MKEIAFVVCLIVSITTRFTVEGVCLDKGCKLSGGLYLKDLQKLLTTHGNDFDGGIKILQWNILYDKKKVGKDIWIYRREHVCKYISSLQPEIIGLQEVMENQLQDLKTCLPDYMAFGESRDNVHNPLYNPIFIKKSERIRVVRNGTFWLSLTPEEHGSNTASSKEPRISTWVELMSKNRNGEWKSVVMATTHLAYRSMETATNQITILLSHLKEVVLNNDQNHPVIITGDFNWGGNSTVYATTEKFGMHNSMVEARWVYPELTALPPYPGLIDYVWQNGFESVLSATMMDARPDNGRMLSDHRPVLAILK